MRILDCCSHHQQRIRGYWLETNCTPGRFRQRGQSGKIKTVIQIVAIVALLINNFPFVFLGIPFDVIAICAMITIYSGIEYFVQNRHLLKGTGA